MAFPIVSLGEISPIKAKAIGIISAEPIPWILLDKRKNDIFGEVAANTEPIDEIKSPYIKSLGL